MKQNVIFLGYTGTYPSLCCGILTLSIKGKIYTFGHILENKGRREYKRFWASGGCCNIGYNLDSQSEEPIIFTRPWKIDKTMLPRKLRKYADEISMVFNAYVPSGCCGGCR